MNSDVPQLVANARDTGLAASDLLQMLSRPKPKVKWYDFITIFNMQAKQQAKAEATAPADVVRRAYHAVEHFSSALIDLDAVVDDRRLDDQVETSRTWSSRLESDDSEAKPIFDEVGSANTLILEFQSDLNLGRDLGDSSAG